MQAWQKSYAIAGVTVVAYFLAGLLGLILLSQTYQIALVWPASAILMTYLYLNAVSKWPPALILCWIAGILADYIAGGDAPTVINALLSAADVFLDSLIGAILLRRFTTPARLFSTIRGTSLFLLLACVIPPIFGGILGGGTVAAVYGVSFLDQWLIWWSSTAVSVSLIMPMLVVFAIGHAPLGPIRERPAEFAGMIALTLAVGVLNFISSLTEFHFLYVPMLLLAALRFGVVGVGVTAVLVASADILSLLADAGRIGMPVDDIAREIQFAQIFIMATFVPTLFCAVVFRERLEIERSLRQAQKMDAVGQLVGGIAHDFNNILGVIQGNLELAQESETSPEETRARIQTAHNHVRRGSALAEKLLSIARTRSAVAETIIVNEPLKELAHLLTTSLTVSIDVKMELDEDIWPVAVDPYEFENAVLNLALNARDAMPNGGLLMIETANKTLNGDYIRLNPEAHVGDYVLVSFSDTGRGMSGEVLERAFEPFYSTKETGRGTGLGLSMVYGFARSSGGHVKIYSEQGVGTTVHLYLPRAAQGHPVAEKPAATTATPRGDETILVIDDEAALVEVAVAYLKSLGYKTLQAASGKEALELLESDVKIDLVFTDVVMPDGIDGYELAVAARKLRPEIKILLTSGFTRKREQHVNGDSAYIATLTSNLLMKPYNKVELAVAVRRLLDGEV